MRSNFYSVGSGAQFDKTSQSKVYERKKIEDHLEEKFGLTEKEKTEIQIGKRLEKIYQEEKILIYSDNPNEAQLGRTVCLRRMLKEMREGNNGQRRKDKFSFGGESNNRNAENLREIISFEIAKGRLDKKQKRGNTAKYKNTL